MIYFSLSLLAQKVKLLNKRHEMAKLRREEREMELRDKVNKKRQYIDELQYCREISGQTKPRMPTPGLPAVGR